MIVVVCVHFLKSFLQLLFHHNPGDGNDDGKDGGDRDGGDGGNDNGGGGDGGRG